MIDDSSEPYSFLMAVHKRTPYLGQAIASVLAQTDPNFQFVIVVNGPDSGLEAEVQALCRSDRRVKILQTNIAQLSFALNLGLSFLSKGYALRMDADDVCFPDRLAITKSRIASLGEPDLLAGSAAIINASGQVTSHTRVPLTHDQIVSLLWRTNPLVHPACAIKVASAIRLGGYAGGVTAQDGDLWLRASRTEWFRFAGMENEVIQYRVHGAQAHRGRRSYAEAAGYRLREFLLGRGIKYLIGVTRSVAGCYFRAKT